MHQEHLKRFLTEFLMSLSLAILVYSKLTQLKLGRPTSVNRKVTFVDIWTCKFDTGVFVLDNFLDQDSG
jgi:hypothetical protein